ncbi:hypothetical protein UlMin_032515, partial [Ulmus minor]
HIKGMSLEMGSPFLPCRTRSGLLVAKAHSLRMWLKDSPFCLDLERGLVPAFKEITERLGVIGPKKFSRLAMLSDERRDKVITTDIEGRKEKLEKNEEKRWACEDGEGQ